MNTNRLTLTMAMLFGLALGTAQATVIDDVKQRISPVGDVKVEQPAAAKPKVPATTEAASKTNEAEAANGGDAQFAHGKKIVTAHCTVCHTQGLAGAPKLGDVAAWAPRIKQGMGTMMKHVKTGLNAMPPKGMCMQCTDEDLTAAVHYMVKLATPKS